jgi:hypothetical protein
MDAPFEEFYCVNETEAWVLFDVRIASAAKQLHRERWAWQETADVKSVDEDHFVLIIRSGAAGRLAA